MDFVEKFGPSRAAARQKARHGRLIGTLTVLTGVVWLAGCSTTVRNYGLDDHFSRTEAVSGSQSTPEQCAATQNAVWVEGADFHECIRYFPSRAFASGHVPRAVVFMEGDVLSTDGASPYYGTLTPRNRLEFAEGEEKRDGGLGYVLIGRPGTDGSSGNQNLRRTRYETRVMNAAIDKLKAKYRIDTFGLIGQSGGGGLVASLIAERHDVLCAVSSSGVTSVAYRAREKDRSTDMTGVPLAQVWDPVAQLQRVHPMPGFRMFVTSDATDRDVTFSSQNDYVQAAKRAGLPIYQVMVHGSGQLHHQTFRVGNRVMQACMAGLPAARIVTRFTGMVNNANNMDSVAESIRNGAL